MASAPALQLSSRIDGRETSRCGSLRSWSPTRQSDMRLILREKERKRKRKERSRTREPHPKSTHRGHQGVSPLREPGPRRWVRQEVFLLVSAAFEEATAPDQGFRGVVPGCYEARERHLAMLCFALLCFAKPSMIRLRETRGDSTTLTRGFPFRWRLQRSAESVLAMRWQCPTGCTQAHATKRSTP